jgi:hypothetical protein
MAWEILVTSFTKTTPPSVEDKLVIYLSNHNPMFLPCQRTYLKRESKAEPLAPGIF